MSQSHPQCTPTRIFDGGLYGRGTVLAWCCCIAQLMSRAWRCWIDCVGCRARLTIAPEPDSLSGVGAGLYNASGCNGGHS